MTRIHQVTLRHRSPVPFVLIWLGAVFLGEPPAAEAASYSAFERLVIVTAGADAGANGQALRDALAYAEAGVPTAVAPWALRLGPGVYDLGDTRLAMVSFVDLEGSGQGTTRITAQTDGGVEKGAIYGADDMEIRHLTVENTGPASVSRAIRNAGVSPRLTHVTATASGGTENNQGITCGGGSVTLMNGVTAIGAGGEIAEGIVVATGGAPVLIQVTAKASGGSIFNWAVINDDATVTIRESKLEATGAGADAIMNMFSAATNVANSQLVGGVSGGGFTCVGAYDGSFAVLGIGCL